MKFAKALEDLMVPEWRTQYVEYKIGKKHIKVVTTNLRNASQSPARASLQRTASRVGAGSEPIGRVRGLSTLLRPASWISHPPNLEWAPRTPGGGGGGEEAEPATFQERSPQPTPIQHPQTTTNSITAPAKRLSANYGTSGFSPSFPLPSIPDENQRPLKPPSLQLPDPIQPDGPSCAYDGEGILLGSPAMSAKTAPVTSPIAETSRPVFARSEPKGSVAAMNPPLLKRIFTLGRMSVVQPSGDKSLVKEVQADAEKEFLKWLLSQLKKCEHFYVKREMESSERFDEMREQLDTMRERWFKAKHNIPFEEDDVGDFGGEATSGFEAYGAASLDAAAGLKKVGWKTFSETMDGPTRPRPTIAQVNMEVMHHGLEGTKDYVRHLPAPTRKPLNNPAHRVAKQKLKRAYIEYYHGLEMLKSYVMVNRECFRKITKKFDKVSGLRTSHRFMTAYVDKSKFGGADNDLDDMLNDTEVLFAQFFESGNRKEASVRLRLRSSKSVYYRSVWMTGFYLGCALVGIIFGLYNAMPLLYDEKHQPDLALRTGYLLQMWGGVALLLGQVLLFAINLWVWTLNKINYAFIFELDAAHQLNYRQFLEFPALLSLLCSVCFWFSTFKITDQHQPHDSWDGRMDMIYWPAIYICIACVLVFNPLHICYYHSRMWFVGALWRTLFSGFYPIEFKDFWMGDVLCSHTYALGNIPLFFCLCSNWGDSPGQCNSNHSRLMGFFTALPGIWRFVQCARRYKSSKMWFPHLVNCGKYLFIISYHMTLSIWRIDKSNQSFKAAFIAIAIVNSIYTTVWDVGMDWSLLDPYAKWPFLRKNLGFKQTWAYYLAMFVDPILRCTWLLYIVDADQLQLQHSTLMPFLLGAVEVLRRFMWCFFRMENEHVGNVGANRAYRNLPLPYRFASETASPTAEEEPQSPIDATDALSELDLERPDTIRRRSRISAPPAMVHTIARVGRTVNQAHWQDYERRRNDDHEEGEVSGESDDEEDGEDYYERTREAEGTMRRMSGIVESTSGIAERRRSGIAERRRSGVAERRGSGIVESDVA